MYDQHVCVVCQSKLWHLRNTLATLQYPYYWFKIYCGVGHIFTEVIYKLVREIKKKKVHLEKETFTKNNCEKKIACMFYFAV